MKLRRKNISCNELQESVSFHVLTGPESTTPLKLSRDTKTLHHEIDIMSVAFMSEDPGGTKHKDPPTHLSFCSLESRNL